MIYNRQISSYAPEKNAISGQLLTSVIGNEQSLNALLMVRGLNQVNSEFVIETARVIWMNPQTVYQ